MKRVLVPALLLAGLSLLVGSAAGAGPSPGITFGSPGVVSHDGKTRFVALRAGRGSLIESISTRAGAVLRTRYLKGVYGLPLVAYDGSTGGLSRKGKRLVVYSPGEQKTRYLVLDPRTLRVRSRIVSPRVATNSLSTDPPTSIRRRSIRKRGTRGVSLV